MDKLAKSGEVQKATVTRRRKSGRQTRKDWQAYPVRSHGHDYSVEITWSWLKMICREKSAEAVVGMVLKWAVPKG